ncbi:hypothetical protein [Paenibacillus sp. GCM10027626]|uniref:hypothetical protein n=1 Tax=Paenibacillus sp. GCM10027626 TaxID=3273411 RepID=UPI0036397D6B
MLKKTIYMTICCAAFAMLFLLTARTGEASAATYYVSDSAGSDSNSGTSVSAPWKTLAKVSGMTFSTGDQILLKSGDTWTGQTLTLHGDGTPANPIVLSSYGTGSKPVIAPGMMDSICISMDGLSGWSISNLELKNAMIGIMLTYNDVYDKSYIHIDNMVFRHMNHTYNSAPETYQHISAGVDVRGLQPWPGGQAGDATDFSIKRTALDDFSLTNSFFYDCDTANFFGRVGIGFMHEVNAPKFTNVVMSNLYTENGGMWGFDFHWIEGGTMTNLRVNGLGSVYNPFGVGGIIVQVCRDLIFDGGELGDIRRNAALYDGVGFDFEGANENITLKNYYIHDTDAEGVFIFNNAGVNKNMKMENNVIANYAKNPGVPDENFAVRILGNSTGAITGTQFINYKPSAGMFNVMPASLTYTNNHVYGTQNWNFDPASAANDFQQWVMAHELSGNVSGGMLTLTSTGGDPYMISAEGLDLDSSNRYFRIRLKNNTNATQAQVFFKTNADTVFTQVKSKWFTIAPNMTDYAEYVVDMGTVSGWNGTIKQLRFDPFETSGSMNIDYIALTNTAAGIPVANAGFENPATATYIYGPLTMDLQQFRRCSAQRKRLWGPKCARGQSDRLRAGYSLDGTECGLHGRPSYDPLPSGDENGLWRPAELRRLCG